MAMTEKKRAAAKKHMEFLMKWGKTHIGYEYGGGLDWMGESMAGMEKRFEKGEIWTPDCRATVLWVAKWSGWLSPTGDGWEGNSTSMWEHLPHFTDIAHAHVGTIITFGVDGDEHVTMVYEPGKTAELMKLMTHGEAFSPNTYSLSVEESAHAGQPVTFCSVEGL